MTQHSDFDDFDLADDFALNNPGALIAALPAVLGFVPEKSLVLVTLERGQLGAVLRVDLSEDVLDEMDRLVEIVSNAAPDAVIAVIVDAEQARCQSCAEAHQDLAASLSAALATEHITLLAVHVVDVVGPGGRWHCVDGCGATGTVDDPQVSPLAAAAVYGGRRLYGSRADLTALIAAEDSRRAKALARRIAKLQEDGDAARAADPDGCTRKAVSVVIDTASRVAAGAVLMDAELAQMGYALTDVIARDILFSLAVGTAAEEAESLWAVLARALPGRSRVEALALLAFSAYARGDGPLAGIALEEAIRCDPRHRMATMLDTALHSGMRPRQIRELAQTGYQLAVQLGVELPPLTPRRRVG
jgi:hypothetical protein